MKGLKLWRGLALSLLAIVLVLVAILLEKTAPLTFSAEDFRGVEAIDRSDRLRLRRASLEDLPGWGEDDLTATIPALLRSCRVFEAKPSEAAFDEEGVGGRFGDWLEPCRDLESWAAAADSTRVAAWLASYFEVWEVSNRGRTRGLFTGYYEPSLRGSRRRHGPYRHPLYRRPPELSTVDLGAFREELKGRLITGRVEGRTFVPFAGRGEIDGGALASRRLELLFVDDPVDAFFLHIQGSGRVELDDGSTVRVGYAGQNGHPYFAIGRELIGRGAIAREEMSMQAIRSWLAEHPVEAPEVLEMNASYVFFRELEGEGPLGSLGVAVTPGRSLAVDDDLIPLGAPFWLATEMPEPFHEGALVPLRRLMVAQDTGGAIRGAVRGDVFWGHGDEAAEIAGRMKEEGRYWIFLPRSVPPPDAFLGHSAGSG